MLNGLANDFKVSDDGILGFLVLEEKFSSSIGVVSNVGERILDMEG